MVDLRRRSRTHGVSRGGRPRGARQEGLPILADGRRAAKSATKVRASARSSGRDSHFEDSGGQDQAYHEKARHEGGAGKRQMSANGVKSAL